MSATLRVGDADVAVYEVSVTDRVIDQTHLGCVETHRTGRNWVAVVVPNRATPGGLDRTFLDRVRGYYYSTLPVRAGDFIEVGGDRVTSMNRRYPNRRYFRVLVVNEKTWVIREASKPEDTLTIPPLADEVALLQRALAPPADVSYAPETSTSPG